MFGQSSGIAISNKSGSLDGLKFSELRWNVDVGELTNLLFGPKQWGGETTTLQLGGGDESCQATVSADKQSGTKTISVAFRKV